MTAQEHRELAERYREQADEMLRRVGGGGLDFEEYMRLSKLANKHMGIYRMVETQRRDRAIEKRRAELDARLAQE